uniref:Transposase Tc1-like domain-containing protein n=1 Tax=Oncorhynchus tshawytscha TaxID=74940 RepID=A0AAZ3S5X3_ONCTS
MKVTVTKTNDTKEAFLLTLKNTKRKMPRVPAHLRERALGMLQGGMRTEDVARAINCNVLTVRRLRQRYRETGWTADRPRSDRPRVTPAQEQYIRTAHLRDRYRMATTTGRVTLGTHNPSISAQTVHNRLRETGLRACRPVVRQVLTRHHRQHRRLWAQAHRRWTRQDWQEVLFSDVSRFCLTRDDGRIRVYCRSATPRPVLWSGIDLEVEGHSIFLSSQRCVLQGRHPPSCVTLPAGSS